MNGTSRWLRVSASAALALAIGLGLEGTAAAFCRTTTCNPLRDASCAPNPISKCIELGAPVAWAGSCLSFSLDTSNLTPAEVPEKLSLVTDAFAAWTQPFCDAGREPSLRVSHQWGPVYCNRAEYNKDQGNANVVAFLDKWPYEAVPGADELGRTTLTYRIDTGEILDADIEINRDPAFAIQFTTETPVPVGSYDLQSVMTHEIGHFLGFAHFESPQTVMRAVYENGANYRETREEDRTGMCAVYPPDRVTSICDYAPLNGFSPECALDPSTGGYCAAQPQRLPGRVLDLALLSGALLTLAMWRRRRRKTFAS
jgi:hypothetical protein